jgi:hypothetical protein
MERNAARMQSYVQRIVPLRVPGMETGEGEAFAFVCAVIRDFRRHFGRFLKTRRGLGRCNRDQRRIQRKNIRLHLPRPLRMVVGEDGEKGKIWKSRIPGSLH